MESAIKKLPELAYLLESLEYSADTGALTWLERPQSHFKTLRGRTIFNTRFAGTLAGSMLNTGYKAVKLGAFATPTEAHAAYAEAHAAYAEAAIALHSAFYNSGAGEPHEI